MNTKNLKLEKIEDFFKEKIKLNPNNLEANFNLARIYKEKGEHKKAKLLYERVIKIEPKNSSAYNNLANIYKRTGEFNKAIKLYKKVILINPAHVNAHFNLGNTLNQVGHFTKAIKEFKKVFELQPLNLENLYIWSDLDPKILNLNFKKKIIFLMSNEKILKKDLAYGNFLLAKYEYKNKNFEKELKYFLKAHQNYYEEKRLFFDKATNYWLDYLPNNKDLLEIEMPEIKNEIKPIFIIGIPRCGSTIVEKVIASGKRYLPIGEECGVISSTVGELILTQKSLKKNVSILKNEIDKKYKNLNLIKQNRNTVFTDKTLENFFFLPLIKIIYPNAKVINCRRNAVSSVISIIKNNLTEVPWAHNLDNIFSYMDIYYKKIDLYKKKYPNFIYDLNFENFQNNPEKEARKVMKFCELDWDKKCLKFYKRTDLISFTSSHRQIRKPIYKPTMDRQQAYRNLLYKYEKKYNWFK